MMESSAPSFKKYILVCENMRDSGACCAPQGQRIRESLKALVKEKGLAAKIRVCRSGCLDVCSEGPNVLLMPDNIWFKRVAMEDSDEIISTALKNCKETGGK